MLVFVKGRMKLRITQPTRKERSAMLERSFTMYGSPPFALCVHVGPPVRTRILIVQ